MRASKSSSPREAEIVNAYFGLDGENGVTIEQIGQKYDLTKERIRQIKERAIKRLQKVDDEEKAEERALEREKAKKLKRDMELKGLTAAEQKKYLEKEKKQEMKKSQKKMTQRA